MDNTKRWMQLQGSFGLDAMLPEMPEGGGNLSNLGDIYPGPIDIGFPPNEKNTLFKYEQNKSIFLLNKKMLLSSFKKREKREKGKKKAPSNRKILTESFLETIKNQDDSTAKDPEKYVKDTLKMKRSDSMDSFDMSSSEEGSDLDVEPVYDKEKTLKQSVAGKKTFLNTLGIQIKLLNRKILQDKVAIEEEEKKGNGGDQNKLEAARNALGKHSRLLRKLVARHKRYFDQVKVGFDDIDKRHNEYKSKKKMVRSSKSSALKKRRYIEMLDFQYEGISIKNLEESKKIGPLSGIGKKTFEKMLLSDEESDEESDEKSKKKKSKKPKKPFPKKTIDDIAKEYDGELMYGDSDGNNCLIFAIANSVGKKIDTKLATSIRENLFEANLAGVDRRGYLPATTRVVNLIAQHVLSELYNYGSTPQVTIHILTVLPNIAPVVVGNGNINVYIVHDGNHYWWLKR